MVADPAELERLEVQYRDKHVDPHSGARATIREADAAVYCVRVRRAMAWAYGAVARRTDWRFGVDGAPA